MIKTLLTILAIIISLPVWAQKPNYVPFQYHGQTGITDVSGNEFLSPGSFGQSYLVVDDFKFYIVKDNLLTGYDFFFGANSGKGEGIVTGQFDARADRLAVGKDSYYHFRMDGSSVMYSPERGVTYLQEEYAQIEPNHQVWTNERMQGRELVWALKMDGMYDVLDAKNGFSAINGLPDFYNYDVIFQVSDSEPMKPIGFAFGDLESIDRQVGQLYGVPESDGQVEVYDIDFKRLGTSAYRAKDISTFFGQAVKLRGGMLPPPQVRHMVIIPRGEVVILNDEYSLIPDESNKQLILVNSKENNKHVLGQGHFDYRYFSTSNNLKALLQIRHGESGSIFYFDFNGTYFPKGTPMIPKNRRDW